MLSGACHCGRVTFRIPDAITDVYRCDCSLCHMKHALMTSVPVAQFEWLTGQDAVSEYNWNTGVARHYFCATCGIYTFHRKRAMPDHYGVNLHCLEGVDLSAFSVRAASGRDMTVLAGQDRPEWPGPRTA